MKCVLMLERTADVEAFRRVAPEHLSYMEELHRSGILTAHGPFQDGLGGMLLIEASDVAAAHAIAAADPFFPRAEIQHAADEAFGVQGREQDSESLVRHLGRTALGPPSRFEYWVKEKATPYREDPPRAQSQ